MSKDDNLRYFGQGPAADDPLCVDVHRRWLMGMFDYVEFVGLPVPMCCSQAVPKGQTKSLDCNLYTIRIVDGFLYVNTDYNGYVKQGNGLLPWTGTLDYHAGCTVCHTYMQWLIEVVDGIVRKISPATEWKFNGDLRAI